MNMIEKIIITGDFLRLSLIKAGLPSQSPNIKWLYYLIQPALSLLTGIPIKIVLFGTDSIGDRIYAINHIPLQFDSWVKLFNKQPENREMAILHDYFSNSLIISFELSERIRKAFDIMEIPYIDFTIHPARFMDDLIFGMRTNIPESLSEVGPWIVYDEDIQIATGMAMATLCRIKRLRSCEDNNDIAIFAGQTNDDKVLIYGDRMFVVEDFIDHLSEISKKHPKILVKPHPSADKNPFVLAMTRLFPNTEMINENFYHILSHDNISHVYSITSSTSIEAGYFGKIGVHLAPYPYCFSDHSGTGGGYLTIRPEFYLPKFWAGWLKKLNMPINNKACSVSLPPERSRMRRSLRSFWGANVFETLT